MPILIEKYNSSHQAAVAEIITTIQQDEYSIPITYADQPDLANIPEFYDSFLVATVSGNPVGTIGLKIIHDFAIIRKMFVAKEFRGAAHGGIAKQLLVAIEEEAREKQITKIYLGTTALFKAAHLFYERNSYLEIRMTDLPESFPVMKVDTKFYCKTLPALVKIF